MEGLSQSYPVLRSKTIITLHIQFIFITLNADSTSRNAVIADPFFTGYMALNTCRSGIQKKLN